MRRLDLIKAGKLPWKGFWASERCSYVTGMGALCWAGSRSSRLPDKSILVLDGLLEISF